MWTRFQERNSKESKINETGILREESQRRSIFEPDDNSSNLPHQIPEKNNEEDYINIPLKRKLGEVNCKNLFTIENIH